MTHQVMNRSFGKALAVATIAFMISSAASTQAQQDQYRCFHPERVRPAVRVPMVPPVYMHPVPNGGRPYPDYRRDERLSLTRQRPAGMAAQQEATNAGLLQIRDALANLVKKVQNQRAQVAAQPPLPPRAIQGAPTIMGPDAKASQDLAGKLLHGGVIRNLDHARDPNGTSATPKQNCSLTSSGPCNSQY
jgi:hypothetical protein